MNQPDSPPLAARVGGRLLAAGFGAWAGLRGDRALHTFGQTHDAVFTAATPAPLDVPLLDGRRPRHVRVRLSRATSLTRRGPDVQGLALVFPAARRRDETHLLFASTGTGLVSRHVLLPRRRLDGPMTTLLAFRTAAGAPCWFRADLALPVIRLSVAVGRRRWQPAGTIRVGARAARPLAGTDPVGRAPQGLRVPAWVAAVRTPPYVRSQAASGRVPTAGR